MDLQKQTGGLYCMGKASKQLAKAKFSSSKPSITLLALAKEPNSHLQQD
jgi:hypothetical protein